MLEAVEKAGVKHMVGFNYRTVPAIVLARKLIDEGMIGDIYHFRGVYLQDWIIDPDFPLVWRLNGDIAGSGPLGDLAAHTIDIAHFLMGEIDELVAQEKTFVTERPPESQDVKGTGLAVEASSAADKVPVTVEDATMFLAKFKNGALGTFEASRFCAGRKNFNGFEINGSKGSVAFNFEHMNYLQFFSREDPSYAQGYKNILATEGEHEYAGAWWPPGHIIGYGETFVNEVYALLEALAEDRMPSPSFVDGVKCQMVLEGVARSVEQRSWVKLSDL
jgi:predicted dehydrogenase